jgi:flagellar biosynthesis protein FlhF
MKTRRIQGTDIQAALREVRRSLGADAVIMSTRETAEGIEIVAAATPRDALAGTRRRAPAAAAAKAAPPLQESAAPPVQPQAARTVRSGGFATLVAGIARRAGAGSGTGAVAGAAAELERLGLSGDVRDALLAEASGADPQRVFDTACAALAARIRVEGAALMRSGGRVAVLGGTGVGKTTTIAKLAAHFARRHGAQQVALINADQYRIGASDQLRRFARLIGVPAYDVHGADELAATLAKLRARRLVLVDTAGIAHGDVRFAEQSALLGQAGLECYLALSLNTQSAVLARSVRAYCALALRGCILTKEDEALSLGAGLSMALRHALPVSFVTTGPGIPADIRLADAATLVARARMFARRARDEEAAGQAAAGVEVAR